MKIDRLAYQSITDFEPIIQQPYSVVLDSTDQGHYDTRYTYIGFDPYAVITVSKGKVTETFRENNSSNQYDDIDDYFNRVILKWINNQQKTDTEKLMGGLIGYMSYESISCFQDFQAINCPSFSQLPEMIWGVYDRLICIDHHQKRCELIVREDISGISLSKAAFLNQLNVFYNQTKAVKYSRFQLTSSVQYPDFLEYKEKVNSILGWIQEGHTYQVNLSQRYQAQFTGDPLALYFKLQAHSPAPYGAYLNYPEVQICSTSPELLISKVGDRLITRPIKGTIKRQKTESADQKNRDKLKQSCKDRAELTMIIDLVRNDLKRVCSSGTVKVGELYRLETFSHLHHLVTDVTGQWDKKSSHWDIIKAVFPGGSITGAPKIRSVELINALELEPRYIYTGSIGYIGFDGNIKLNIAIRTLYAHNKEVYFHSGSGIIADSNPKNEWDELKVKVQGIYSALMNSPK